MPHLTSLLNRLPDILLPSSIPGVILSIVTLIAGLGVIIFYARQWREYEQHPARRYWIQFGILLAATPFAVLLVGVELPTTSDLIPANVPIDQPVSTLILFAALPWALAGGLLGPTAGAVIGGVSGIFMGLWSTHRLLTPVEISLIALFFSAAVNQRYRTRIYKALRQPVLVALALAITYPLLYLTTTLLSTPGSLAQRLDFGFSSVGMVSAARGGELLIAGILTQLVSRAVPLRWGRKSTLEIAPYEKSLRERTQLIFFPLFILLMVTLIVADWVVAGSAARKTLEEQMRQTALLAGDQLPMLTVVGDNLIQQIASDLRLNDADADSLGSLLEDYQYQVPFFTELFLLTPEEPISVLGGSPAPYPKQIELSHDELIAINHIRNQVNIYHQTAPPLSEDTSSASITFFAAVKRPDQRLVGILLGRTELDVNSFSRPVLNHLESISKFGGEGMLLDRDLRIVYHTGGEGIMSVYPDETFTSSRFFSSTGEDGTRQYVYFHPPEGSEWTVVLTTPAQHVQQVALEIAAPLLVLLVVVAGLTLLLLRFGLDFLTNTLQDLAHQADYLAQGELSRPFTILGEDEVGRLGKTLESMRQALKARLEELNRLLQVSQGVAASLEFQTAVEPILDAARSYGAASARIVLLPSTVPELEGDPTQPVSFGRGANTERFSGLDSQLVTLTGQHSQLVLTNLNRTRLISFKPGQARPAAILAISLRHEGKSFGVLWTAYDFQHLFSAEEVNFMITLGGYAALAAANARLYLMAESRRQRLAAILTSSPDPVLVIDEYNRLLLANPAAWRVFGLGVEWEEGRPIDTLITQPELLEFIVSASEDKTSAEIELNDEAVYFATVSSVWAEGSRVGRVCVLRDVTHFKKLDTLKSEFVATVSHDLRSPLALMRGYASMLDMVGKLNEQQVGYVQKIIGGVETMTRLVNELLDLGRIDAGVALQIEQVPVYELVERVVSALQLQATQKKIKLRTELPADTNPVIEADQAFLQQALHNLVENAIKYTEAGGQVVVQVETRQDMLVFAVKDTGIGISPVDQPRLFEKFYRASQQVGRRKSGSGLGLAIVKSIAERHNGRVWMDSKLGKGSIFYLALPLHQMGVKAMRRN